MARTKVEALSISKEALISLFETAPHAAASLTKLLLADLVRVERLRSLATRLRLRISLVDDVPNRAALLLQRTYRRFTAFAASKTDALYALIAASAASSAASDAAASTLAAPPSAADRPFGGSALKARAPSADLPSFVSGPPPHHLPPIARR